MPSPDILAELLEWLDDLDEAWLLVLNSKAWDPESQEGVDIDHSLRSSPLTQTERTRLRSLLVGGEDRLEEWMAKMETEEEDLQTALERMGVQQGFDELFARTMSSLGALQGVQVIADAVGAMSC
jgi:hypothetical protein